MILQKARNVLYVGTRMVQLIPRIGTLESGKSAAPRRSGTINDSTVCACTQQSDATKMRACCCGALLCSFEHTLFLSLMKLVFMFALPPPRLLFFDPLDQTSRVVLAHRTFEPVESTSEFLCLAQDAAFCSVLPLAIGKVKMMCAILTNTNAQSVFEVERYLPSTILVLQRANLRDDKGFEDRLGVLFLDLQE
ncbi:hypothetical protein U1Q18_044766 [Sarracenia purpurea var. burkii]